MSPGGGQKLLPPKVLISNLLFYPKYTFYVLNKYFILSCVFEWKYFPPVFRRKEEIYIHEVNVRNSNWTFWLIYLSQFRIFMDWTLLYHIYADCEVTFSLHVLVFFLTHIWSVKYIFLWFLAFVKQNIIVIMMLATNLDGRWKFSKYCRRTQFYN